MRALAYADSCFFSGAEKAWDAVVRGLSAHPEVELWVAAPESNHRLRAVATGAAANGSRLLPAPAQPPRIAAAALLDPRRRRAVRALVEQAAPDVVLVNLPSAEYGATPLAVARPDGPPVVALLHVPHSLRRVGFTLGRARDRLASMAIRRAAAVCVVAPSAARTASLHWRYPGTVAVVPLPAPEMTVTPPPEARRRLGLPPGPLVAVIG